MAMVRLVARGALAAVLLLLLGAVGVRAESSFVEFESGQVRPLALSPDGNHLFAVNTPDDRLEIFDVSGGGLGAHTSVPVGLEPVAVAAGLHHHGAPWAELRGREQPPDRPDAHHAGCGACPRA